MALTCTPRTTGPASALAASLLAIVAASCSEEDGGRITVAMNVPPVARIMAPPEVGRGELVRLDGTASRDADGLLIRYAWDFGDGSATASTAVAFHAFSRMGEVVVRLEVTDNRGATDTATAALRVVPRAENQPPTALIVAPGSADPGVPVLLDGSGSTDADGRIQRYDWDLGGGLTAVGVQVSHTFARPGRYDVRLTVTDDKGARASATHAIDVGGGSENLAPIADAGPDLTVGIGEAAMLDGSGSLDPDGRLVRHAWTLGDGGRATGERAAHTYNVEGRFVVELTVTDDGGLSATDTATVTVVAGEYGGEYSMVANPAMQRCSGLPAQFVATTVTFAVQGGSITATTPNPENPGGAPIVLSGTLVAPNFTTSGVWTDSQGGEHAFDFGGTFVGTRYTGTMVEALTFASIPLCTLTWNLSGDRLP
jgi:PKD repeat protein